jgi:saccharopine dehydrogenase-like NADP-dependent oxidoreductase
LGSIFKEEKMKILALGGCGEMGRKALKTLMTYDFVEHIVLADINQDRAQRAAKEFGPHATPLRVDVSDTDALRTAMKDIDVVMNTVGPYYRFGVKVLSASIDSGCHYFDINDDWEPTLEMLALDEDAKSSGITAVIGMGASPGMSNMLAVKAMSELDTAQEIFTGWDLDSAKPQKIGPEPTAATIHGIHQLTGLIRVYRNGLFTDARPIQKIRLDYPGIGPRPVWTIGHPEAVTLPRYYPALRSSTLHGLLILA